MQFLVSLEEFLMYVFSAFGGGALLSFIFYVFTSTRQSKTLWKANLLRRATDVDISQDGVVDIHMVKRRPDLEALQFGRFDYKWLPKGDNPVISKPFFWAKSGMGVFLSASEGTTAVSPETAVAIEAVEQKEEVPDNIKKWLKNHSIDLPKIPKPPAEKTREPLKTKKIKLFLVDPRKLKEYFRYTRPPDQARRAMKEHEMIGEEKAGKQWGKAALALIPIIIIMTFCVVIIASVS